MRSAMTLRTSAARSDGDRRSAGTFAKSHRFAFELRVAAGLVIAGGYRSRMYCRTASHASFIGGLVQVNFT